MTKYARPPQPAKILILSGLFLFLFLSHAANSQESRQLTQIELNTELRTALEQNNEARIVELIKNHRLFIKPFVDELVKESISMELKGKLDEAEQLNRMAAKTAEVFNRIFNEKSLLIAVNYLKIWSKGQKGQKLVADSLYAAGTRLRAGEPQKAIEIYNQAGEIYKSIGDERGQSEILGGLGYIYSTITDYKTSLSYYLDALPKREKVDDKVLIGNTLNSLGSLYYGIFKEYAPALDYFDKAEIVRREIGDSLNLGRTIHLKASTLENLSQFERSLAYYRRSFELNQASGDQGRVEQSLLKSGTILNNMGKYQDALESLGKAEKMYMNLGDSTGLSDSYTQIGFVYLRLGDLNATLEKFSQAVNITEKQNDQWGLAGVYNNMGLMLKEAGRYEKALEYANKALGLYEKLQDQASIIICLNNIGTIFFDMKDYPEAEEYHLKGLKISRELKILDQEASYLLNLANDRVMMGKAAEALLSYKEGFEIARKLNNPDLIWKFITGLAETYETSGEFDKVVELNDTALKIIEGLRNTLPGQDFKASFMAKERYVYEDIIDLLEKLHEREPAKGYDKLAFSYAEQSKSRVLMDLLSGSPADSIINHSGSEDNPDPQPMDINELMELLPDKNNVILEYSVGDSSSCLWVVTKSRYKLYKLPARKKLQEQIETIRFALLEPSEGVSEFFTQAGTSLYNELIKPAEAFIGKKSRLVIIPDGVLNYLPFEVLFNEDKTIKKASYADIPFLVKKYPVSYVQSAGILKTLFTKQAGRKESTGQNKRLLAFGDPVYEDTLNTLIVKYPRLGFSGREVEAIASFFDPGSSDIYLRDKATEESFKQKDNLQEFNYLHFATHGIIDEDKPDLSSLVLTSRKDSGEDGYLQAQEIFSLKLNPDLVVLSACQTGLGKLIRGEGMVGLTRAFMYAGTPSVVVSLWSVSDISTADLMEEFYKNLIKNKLSKTDALRKAQLSLISDPKYSHPFYWAPFILIGDWR